MQTVDIADWPPIKPATHLSVSAGSMGRSATSRFAQTVRSGTISIKFIVQITNLYQKFIIQINLIRSLGVNAKAS